MKKAVLINLILLLTLTLSSCMSGGAPSTTVSSKAGGDIKAGQLKVHFIDVGQADCILVEQGSQSMLIDAGNKDDGDGIIKYIKQQGIDRFDYVVGTHPHEDHIGGMAEVIQAFKVDKVYLPKVTHTSSAFESMVSAIKNQGLKATAPVPGSSFKLGEATCTILAPNEISYAELNNYSIVIKMAYDETSFLFTGDAETVSEQEMLDKGYDLSADVLKVGHHGSSTSTSAAFLNAVQPRYAVISLGKNNSYGFPHRETMSKLKSNHVIVYRTDESGTVVAVSDGKTITFSGSPGSYANGGKDSAAPAGGTKYDQSLPDTGAAAVENQYIGNKNSKKFHRPTCSGLPSAKNQVVFETRDEAIEQGYAPCGSCDP
ncbi:MAG TPA: MBL fold metallo-hydrolase [Syntrophomonas sp.]|nr:MBL fold metallo-hydrolase [Syntrophomonas sp.]